jgi:hypothetical protein
MNPIDGLLRSRKFWLLVLDTVISLGLFLVGEFLGPETAEKITYAIGLIQPVFVAVIVGIFVEDAAAKRAGVFPGK